MNEEYGIRSHVTDRKVRCASTYFRVSFTANNKRWGTVVQITPIGGENVWKTAYEVLADLEEYILDTLCIFKNFNPRQSSNDYNIIREN